MRFIHANIHFINPKDSRNSQSSLLVSFLFIFQNDNELIDNDNAGQSPAAQAVVLTFSLTYILNTISFYLLAVYIYVSILITLYFRL